MFLINSHWPQSNLNYMEYMLFYSMYFKIQKHRKTFSFYPLYNQDAVPAHKIKNNEMKYFLNFPFGWANDILHCHNPTEYTKYMEYTKQNHNSYLSQLSHAEREPGKLYTGKCFPKCVPMSSNTVKSLKNIMFNSIQTHPIITRPLKCFLLIQ